jgi:cholesterol oxidase
MGRDASTAITGFDGKGVITSARRSQDSALYDEIEDAITKVGRHYESRRMFLNFLSGRGPEGLFTVHPLGGCSIGWGPEEGFTNHRGEVFGHPGLFIADGSLYPKSPGIAPSMTIAALAERQAARMADGEDLTDGESMTRPRAKVQEGATSMSGEVAVRSL